MKNLVFLLLFSFTHLYPECQTFNQKNERDRIDALIKKGDSLKKIDNTAALDIFKKGLAIALDNKNNSKAAIFYKKIGALYHRKRDYIKAEFIYKNGLALDSTSKVAADLNYNISLLKARHNQQDSLLTYLKKSIDIYENFDPDKSIYKAYLKAGIVYKNRQLYEDALIYSIKAYEGFKKTDNKQKLADVCTIIGNIQNQLKNHNQALIYYFQALELEQKLNNNLGIGICYTNIANAYDNLKILDSAIVNYKKGLKFLDKNSSQYAILLSNLALTYKSLGKTKASEENFIKSITINSILKDTISLLYNYNGITNLYLEYFDLDLAKQNLNKANQLLPSVTNQQAILSHYKNEAEYYKKKGLYKKALEVYEKHSNLYEVVYNSEQTKLVQNLQAKFENKKKENEILKLNIENKNAQILLTQKNENIKSKNLTVIILATITLLLIVVYYFFVQKQRTVVQSNKIEKLEAIYQGQETIKKRIARDLHDIITTNFDGLRLRVLALKRSKKLNQMVDEITEDLKKMNQQIRVVSHRIYPLEMYMGSQKFTDIIKSRLSEFQLYGNIFVELETQLPDVLNTLPLVVKNNFYGILLEVLNNVEKHSLATKITIKNYKDNNDNLHFLFDDNGIGIENNHKEGIGLLNIKQRVEIIEGKCKIEKTHTGTQVHVNFPIQKDL
ncbi:ATP-binding protein [uncultured Algibacter sp.]|uniref:ATP-binding protein n=1 Tax=uncultured Algibacter sp. TaxID=298659 RepID=UPI00262FB890|nr:ATP-binding protein [uncultured Algibacter sp.]